MYLKKNDFHFLSNQIQGERHETVQNSSWSANEASGPGSLLDWICDAE